MVLTYLIPASIGIATFDDLSSITAGYYPIIANYLGFGDWLGYTLLVGGMASTFGTYCSQLQTNSLALFELSVQGKTLPCFSSFPKVQSPVIPILFIAFIDSILILFQFELLVQVQTVFYSVHTIIFTSSLVRLRFTKPELERPFKLPGGKIGATLIVACPIGVALTNIVTTEWLVQTMAGTVLFFILLTGILLYFYRRKKTYYLKSST